ncbi:unnamed protein product [Rhizophagus irregularis]|nr:unnamed protein product [Rhizophagus irregularis]
MEQDNDNANENITLSTETVSLLDVEYINCRPNFSRCLDCEFSGSEPKENNHISKRNKGITKFVNNHNHHLLADTELFLTEFRSLSDDIKQDINYYVECGVCDFPTIRALLEPKYQNQFMSSQDLSNYIQKVKKVKADTYNDSARLLENLLAQYKESWAYCFTLRLFTGGIQSTQRVESLNGILHKAIESRLELGLGLGLGLELGSDIRVRLGLGLKLGLELGLELGFITYKYAKTHYNQPYMVAVIFKNISTPISYWLSPNLFEEFKKHMVESQQGENIKSTDSIPILVEDRRWFKENLQSDDDNINQSLIITLGEDYTAEVSNNDSFNKIDFNTEQPSIYQQIKESGLQKQVKKKNEFSSMISLAKTTINLAEVGDQMHFKKMLTENYDELIKTKEKPLEHIGKGRPSSKRLKSSVEVSKKGKNKENQRAIDGVSGNKGASKRGYGCRRCGDMGHNVRTCKVAQ